MEDAKKNDENKKIREEQIDEGQMIYFISFRCGILLDGDPNDETSTLADDFKSDLATEMAYAIKRVQEGIRNEDGTPKYKDFITQSEMKVSLEMTDWIKV